MRHVILLAAVAVLTVKAQIGGGQGQLPSIPTDTSVGMTAAGSGFSPWLSANGSYRRNLDRSSFNYGGDGFAPFVAGGVSAWKSGNQKQVGVSYSGSASRFQTGTPNRDWNHNHVVNLNYGQVLNRKLSFGLSQLAGITYGGFGYGSAFGITGVAGLGSAFGAGSPAGGGLGGGFGDIANNGLVSGELLNTQIKFFSTSGSLSYMLNQRWMLSGIGGFSTARRSSRQTSQEATQVGAGLGYMVSQRTQVGVQVMQQNIRYPSLFGGMTSQSAMLNLQTNLTQSVTVGVGGGAGRIGSNFIGQVAIDPSIAALLGGGTILQVTKTEFLTPYYNASITKQFQSGAFTVMGGRGTNAGNGVVLAGVQDMLIMSYSHTLNQRTGAAWFGSYQKQSGRVATLAVSENAQTGGMLSVRLFNSVSFTGQAGMNYLSVGTTPRQRFMTASVGLAWMLGDRPFMF